MSAVAIVLEVTVCVEPAKWAMPTPGEDATTHVAHAIVPLVVIVPPVIGEVVAMLVTVPDPAGVLHEPSPRRNVLLLQVPLNNAVTLLDVAGVMFVAVENAASGVPLL